MSTTMYSITSDITRNICQLPLNELNFDSEECFAGGIDDDAPNEATGLKADSTE